MMILGRQIGSGRLVWALRLYASRLGWPGILGSALIVASLLSVPMLLLPMQGEARAIRDNAQALRESAVARSGIEQQGDPAFQLAEFYKSFPGTQSLTDTLQNIYATAAGRNIALSQGDYSLVEPESGLLQRYEISLSVRASYAQVRDLLAQVLAENKNVALLTASLNRNASTDAVIDAELRLAVYVQDRP
jgi:hypothetical protein